MWVFHNQLQRCPQSPDLPEVFLHFYCVHLIPFVMTNNNPTFHANSNSSLPCFEQCNTNVEPIVVKLMINHLAPFLPNDQAPNNVPGSICIHYEIDSHFPLEFVLCSMPLWTLQISKNNIRPRLIFGMQSGNNPSSSKSNPCFLDPFGNVLYFHCSLITAFVQCHRFFLQMPMFVHHFLWDIGNDLQFLSSCGA